MAPSRAIRPPRNRSFGVSVMARTKTTNETESFLLPDYSALVAAAESGLAITSEAEENESLVSVTHVQACMSSALTTSSAILKPTPTATISLNLRRLQSSPSAARWRFQPWKTRMATSSVRSTARSASSSYFSVPNRRPRWRLHRRLGRQHPCRRLRGRERHRRTRPGECGDRHLQVGPATGDMGRRPRRELREGVHGALQRDGSAAVGSGLCPRSGRCL